MNRYQFYELLLIILIACLCLSGSIAWSQQSNVNSASGVTLDSILHAVSEHPMVRMKNAEAEAARRRISELSTLPDPMVMLGVENLPTNSFRFDQEMMTSKMIGVSENFPFFGKLSNQRSLAEQSLIGVRQNIAEEENKLRRGVRLMYFEIVHLEKSLETNRSHLKTIAELTELSGQSLTLGFSTVQDILSLKIESAQIRSKIAEEESMINMLIAELSGASGIHINGIRYEGISALPIFTYRIELLDSLARVFRPALLEMYTQAERSSYEIERARLMQYPDFTIGLNYMQRDAVGLMKQSDMFSAAVSFNLPLSSGRLADALGEQEAMRTARYEGIEALKLEIHTMLSSSIEKIGGISEQFRILNEEILPLSEMSLATSRTNYQNSKASLSEVLRSELTVLHRLHEKYQLQAEFEKAVAEIEYLTGVDLITLTD
ncbi:MAG: TolC family protein [Ignavibacteriota bacterium]